MIYFLDIQRFKPHAGFGVETKTHRGRNVYLKQILFDFPWQRRRVIKRLLLGHIMLHICHGVEFRGHKGHKLAILTLLLALLLAIDQGLYPQSISE